MRFEATAVVARPAADVFAVLADYGQDPRWRRGVVDMAPEPPGLSRPGTRTLEVLRVLGTTHRNAGEVTEVLEGRHLAWRAEGASLLAWGTRGVEPEGDGACRVTMTTHVRLRGVWRLGEPLVGAIYPRQLRADLARLRMLLES